MESTRMKNLILGFALVVGTTVTFVAPLAGQDAAPTMPPAGRGGGRGAGRGAPAPPAGPMPRLPDGHPDMQGFWNPPAITDIEPAAGRGAGGRGAAPGGAARGGAPAGPPPGGGA